MNGQKPRIFCIGVSHNSADIAFRETLFLNPEQLEKALIGLKSNPLFKEIAILSTCNRFEMFGVIDGNADAKEAAYQGFLELQLQEKKQSNLSVELLKNSSFFYEELEAIEHIFSVVSSLDSVVLGETQITGQFKDAIALAKKAQSVGPTLDRLGQEALAITKKIRTNTSIGEKTVSISHAAIDLAKKVFVNLSEHNFLIIGAGEMAELAAKYAAKYKPKSLSIANRTLGKAEALVSKVGSGTAYSLNEIEDLIPQMDIIICSTSAPNFVITKKMLDQALPKRRSGPLFLVDIALPRDIDPECSKIDDLYLFEIDDLKQVVDENIDLRKQAAHEGFKMIEKHTQQFIKWLDSHSIKPVLADFNSYLEELFSKEAEKSLGKNIFNDLTPEQKEAIKEMLSSIAKKIAGDASRPLKNPPEGYFKEQLVDSLKLMFSKKD